MTQAHTRAIFTALILTVVSLSGCATVTPEFCDSDTWHERGVAHAMNGEQDQSDDANNDCAAKDAPIAYRMGFDYGLKKYCTFEKGLWAGEMGQGPAESCATPGWDEYQTGYVTGHKIFKVNTHLESISKELEATRNMLWKLESAGQTPDSPEIREKTARIEQLKHDREQASEHLMNLRAQIRHD